MSRIETTHTVHEKPISYEVVENGYDIYLDGKIWITQHEPYIPNKELSYEENAIAQIERISEGFKKSAETQEVESEE